jgi:hypothetical protein
MFGRIIGAKAMLSTVHRIGGFLHLHLITLVMATCTSSRAQLQFSTVIGCITRESSVMWDFA